MSSTPQEAEELRIAGESCKKRLHDLLDASKRKEGYILNILSDRRVLNHSQRYGMWTANVAILETGPHSLDFRLNEKKILRNYVLSILEEINQQLSRVITIATTSQAATTSKLYTKTSDSNPNVVEEEVRTQEPRLAAKTIHDILADEEEIIDGIIKDRLDSLFDIATALLPNEASAPMEHARFANRNVQNALTAGAEQLNPSTMGGTQRSLCNEARTMVSGATTQPGHSVEKGRVSKKDLDETSNKRAYHIVVLGASSVGKSCLTAQFVQGVWIESHDRTIEDSYRKQLAVDGRQCVLEILDTVGEEQFAATRELHIESGQGFLLVFSLTSLSSLDDLSALREQIIGIKKDPLTPLVLVGNKSDLEEDRVVSRSRALQVSQSWNNAPYYETSARARWNVDEAFVDLCRQIVRQDGRTRRVQAFDQKTTYRGRGKRKKKEISQGGNSRCIIL